MEIACKGMARAVGAERQGDDENTVNEQNECTVTWSVKLEATREEEFVSGGFSDDVCYMCGGRFAVLDRQTEHFIRHKDQVCCHLCQMKFSHTNSLALHLQNTHPENSMFCKRCNMCMGRHLANEWSVETDKTPVTPKIELLDEEVEEVIVENEEVEIKYVKEEEEEVAVGRMEETKESGIAETPEDNKRFISNLHDHTYFSTQTCSSFREATNNVVMYTSTENVLVFINKTDTSTSPKDESTESDQQGTPVDDQMVCGVIHDHTYISTESLANPMPLEEHVSAHDTCSFFCKSGSNVMNSSTENMHVLNDKADTRVCTNDPEGSESDQDQIWKHDHAYFSGQDCANCELEVIPEDVVIGEYEEIIPRCDHEDSDLSPIGDLLCASQLDLSSYTMDSDTSSIEDLGCASRHVLSSDRMSCTSTDREGETSEEGCTAKSWSVCQKPSCVNVNQKSLGSVDSVNANPAGLCKDLQICISCGLSKVPSTKKSMERCACTPFICPLCGIAFGTEEMLLNHQAEKHPSTKYICARCLQLFPNQKTFLQHVCSNSKAFSGESLTPSKSSNDAKESLLTILNAVPSVAASESSKQPLSSQRVGIVNTAPNLGTAANSTSRSCPNGASICFPQKVPVQVMTSRPSSCAQQKKGTSLAQNGGQGQMTTPISTVTQKQIAQVQVLSSLQANLVTQTSSSSSSSSSSSLPSSLPSSTSPSSSTQILLLSPQDQGQMTHISTVPQTKSRQMEILTSMQTKVMTHARTGSADSTSRAILPPQHPSSGVHLPPSILSRVSSSVSVLSQTGQPCESTLPFLDACRSSQSTMILPSSQGPLKIVAMFVNQSKELALQKRLCQSWRSKAVIPCRQCGAVSRQFSLGVRHRYQHRGPRIHKCQCGRAFQQRMHLLRHQVQHAEATRYVCAACGQMFCGTQHLARHRALFRITPSNRKKRANKECRNIFQCYCGHSFTRPAALLWHMLKNAKARKPRLKGFRLT